MVQLKTSTLVLASVIASYAYGSVGAREHRIRELPNELEVRGLDLDHLLTRVAIFEDLHERGVFDSEPDNKAHESAVSQAPEGVVGFFKDVGKFVRRCAHTYWTRMVENAGIFDARQLVEHRSRHRFEAGDVQLRGLDAEYSELEARHHADWHKWRRQFEGGHQVMSRGFDEDSQLEARNHHDWSKWRRRFENNREVLTRSLNDHSNVEAREDTPELLPRMSWFGKALLIYRDIKNPQLEKRSAQQHPGELMYRELMEDLEVLERAYDDYMEERGFDGDLDELD
ncbi:hypothetical protein FA15DRAFT_675322 [Coprinopsis marcescibilis]|uniref:Uncharacterized protein n=1 Tax=Coprinopsis marcescibilis TaxID=230819 RepID=A0A5C3KEM8_COPMA|nr:hypothetical protein FA15DRAFT_675322 [Coprinopsis marcescibilis]